MPSHVVGGDGGCVGYSHPLAHIQELGRLRSCGLDERHVK